MTAPTHPGRVWRAAAPLTAVAALLVAVPATVLAGLPGLLGALLGALVVVLFFGLDMLLAAIAPSRLDPVGLAVLSYVVKLVLLGVLLLGVRGAELVAAPAFLAATGLCTVGWLAGHVRAVSALGRLPWPPAAPSAPAAPSPAVPPESREEADHGRA